MNIAVIGAGAVGGYFGGRIANAGHEVNFIARGAALQAIQKEGLQVKSIKGDFTIYPAQVTSEINAVHDADLIILGVKAWQIKEVAEKLAGIIKNDSTVMPLQNGVLAAEELMNCLPEKNVINGLCRIFSMVKAPGIISHLGIEPIIMFGEMNNEKTERVLRIKEVLDDSGITNEIPMDISVALWNKFIMICLSGLCAVARSPYGVVRELEGARQMMISVLTEIYNVGIKAGVNLDKEIVNKTMAFVDSTDYNLMPSLTRDVLEGRPSEIEYQNGSVVKLGKKYGVETPINSFIYNCIVAMERNR